MNSLIGTWKLVSHVHQAADGSVNYSRGKDAKGQLIYTADGTMSVFLMRASRPPFLADSMVACTTDEKAEAFDACLSYCGRYRIEENKVIHIIEMSVYPNWVGTEQVRYFQLNGSKLILMSPPFQTVAGKKTAIITWEKY